MLKFAAVSVMVFTGRLREGNVSVPERVIMCSRIIADSDL